MRTFHTRLALAVVAAASAAAIGGFLPTGTAVADHDTDGVSGLRAENRRLRAELRAYRSAYVEAVDGLDQVDEAAEHMRGRGRQIERIAERARDRAIDLVRDYQHYDDRDGGYDDDRYGHRPLSDREFQEVYKRVAAASFADDQLALVRSVARSSYVTVDQAVALMKACTFEDTRIEIAVALYPRIVDMDRWYRINDAFGFSSSKETLRNRIGK